MLEDERYENWGDVDCWDPEDYYPEDDYDREFVDQVNNDVEDRCDEILDTIDEIRRTHDLTSVDRAILDLLEEIVDLL